MANSWQAGEDEDFLLQEPSFASGADATHQSRTNFLHIQPETKSILMQIGAIGIAFVIFTALSEFTVRSISRWLD